MDQLAFQKNDIKSTVITLSITDRNFQQIDGDLAHFAGRLFLGIGAITSARLVKDRDNGGFSIRWKSCHVQRLYSSAAFLWPDSSVLSQNILDQCFDYILKKLYEKSADNSDRALRFLLTKNEGDETYLLLAQIRPVKKENDIILRPSFEDRWCRFPSLLKAGFYTQDIEQQKIVQSKLDNYEAELLWCYVLDEKSYIAECTSSNIFIFDGVKFSTPALKPGILSGIARRKVIDFFIKNDIPLEERDIELKELKDCQSIWLTNAVRGVRAVTLYDGKMYKKENEYMKSFCDKEI